MDRTKILDYAASSPEERILLAHLLDLQRQCSLREIPACSAFLSPQEQAAASRLLQAAGGAAGVFSGGYPEAQRQKLCFLPPWAESAEAYDGIRVLRARFYEKEELTHRDFLGSLMALGVAREKLGDILVSPGSADVLADGAVADFLLQSWDSAGRVRLQLEEIPRQQLYVPEQKVQQLRDTLASLRLDALVAAGFSMSRGRAAQLIESGRVQLNYRENVKADAAVKQGDVVSARGFGKFTLAQVGATTKKGRIAVCLHRFL